MTLTDTEIDRMQAVGDAHLAGTAVIQRATAVSDAGGGGSLTWNNVGTVSARFAPVLVRPTDIEGERLSSDIDSIVTLPAGTDIREEDRIAYAGGTLAVTNARLPQTWEINRRVEMTEV